MQLGATIALAVSIAFSGSSSQMQANAAAMIQAMPASKTVEEYVREYFAEEPVMAEIAKCESQFRQFGTNGKIIKNPTSTAVGVFQIMSSIHADFADEKLGLDIYSLQGNAAYAKYLFDKQGTVPWDSSKSCWGKTQAYKDHVAKADKAEFASK